MIKSIEQLKAERPDLVDLFENMNKEELLKQCYLEVIDGLNMEERVSLFMTECTDNMSKTNYTMESLKSLISSKKEKDIEDFCNYIIEESENDQEISEEIWYYSSIKK